MCTKQWPQITALVIHWNGYRRSGNFLLAYVGTDVLQDTLETHFYKRIFFSKLDMSSSFPPSISFIVLM